MPALGIVEMQWQITFCSNRILLPALSALYRQIQSFRFVICMGQHLSFVRLFVYNYQIYACSCDAYLIQLQVFCSLAARTTLHFNLFDIFPFTDTGNGSERTQLCKLKAYQISIDCAGPWRFASQDQVGIQLFKGRAKIDILKLKVTHLLIPYQTCNVKSKIAKKYPLVYQTGAFGHFYYCNKLRLKSTFKKSVS